MLERVPGSYLLIGNGQGADDGSPASAARAWSTTPATTSTTPTCRSAPPTGCGWPSASWCVYTPTVGVAAKPFVASPVTVAICVE